MIHPTGIFFRDGDDTKPLCPHVQIVGRFYPDEDSAEEDAEYLIPVRIACNMCVKTFELIRVVG